MIKDFLKKLANVIEKRIGENYHVEMSHVIKNNGVELDGLSILGKGERCVPTLYVNEYYENFLQGMSIEKIADQILTVYWKAKEQKPPSSIQVEMSFNNLREKIVYRLVNYEKNKEELKSTPHIRFLDLAITFHCLVKQEDTEIGTIRITNNLVSEWKFDTKDLWEIARKNTPGFFPVEIRPMSEIIQDIIRKELSAEAIEFSKEYFHEDIFETEMYIMTNRSGINGAATILYEDVIHELAESFKSDFYILPSSIHEVILIPYREHYMKNELCAMVSDVNRTQVPDEDILSDKVYLYKRERKLFEI